MGTGASGQEHWDGSNFFLMIYFKKRFLLYDSNDLVLHIGMEACRGE